MSKKTSKIYLKDLLEKIGHEEVRIEIPVKGYEEIEWKSFFGDAKIMSQDEFIPKDAVVSNIYSRVVTDIDCDAYDFQHEEKGDHLVNATLNDEEYQLLEELSFDIGSDPHAFATSIVKDYLKERNNDK